MTLPRTAADVLADHVTMELECIDRMYLNVHVPKLAFADGIAHFFRTHRGQPFVSSALMDPITKGFVAAIHRFVTTEGVDLVPFRKGERKDDVAHAYLADHDGSEQILFVGRAQEKTNVFRTQRRHNPITGKAYPWLVADTSMVNHFYFYGFDDDFGPFFIKFATYFPYVAKCCLLTELRDDPLRWLVTVRSRVRTGRAAGSWCVGCCSAGRARANRGPVRAVSAA